MKHYQFAMVELFGYLISWFVAISILVSPNPGEGLFVLLLIFLIEHPVDAILTYSVAKKGLNPRHGPDEARALAEQSVDADDGEEELLVVEEA